jgi:glycosyltransferase involved in cell wall biosynthesis/ADP-heptose:LPS heptosyltransferase
MILRKGTLSKKNKRKKKHKKAAPRTQIAVPQQVGQFPPKLPRISGGEFNEPWTVEKLQEAIDKTPKRDEKLRVLFLGEASFLHTGFSHYWHNVLPRLHATDKYEIAELGSYAKTSDPRAKNIPWKFYGIMPEDNEPHMVYEYGRPDGTPQERERYRENQFGKYVFDMVVADFKPDIIIDIRDYWMTYWQHHSVFREYFHWMWMACVDSYPQKWEWMQMYGNVDTLVAYSHFGKRVLEEQSRCDIAKKMIRGIRSLDVKEVCQPGIDIDIYRPMDRDVIRKKYNIPPNVRFIGTVMRNQKRKRFPELIEAFGMFKEQNGWKEPDPRKRRIKNIHDIKLLLHTSIQDVGFDIPEVVRREGLGPEVYYSYLCTECSLYSITTCLGQPAVCPRCNKKTFITPNTQIGLPDKEFAEVFNLMDVYCQMSIAEGDGMPVQNAKSCGVPVIMSDYSALSEKARNGGGFAIKGEVRTESETMQLRFWFDRQALVEKLTRLFKKPDLIRKSGENARRCIEEYYNWDFIAKKWELLLDTRKTKGRKETWNKPAPAAVEMPREKLHDLKSISDDEFIDRCYRNILGREPDGGGRTDWLEGLKRGQPRKQVETFFRNITGKKNRQAQLLSAKDPGKAANPLEHIMESMDSHDKLRILYCMPQTAGDLLVSTAILDKLKEVHPEASIYVATEKRYFGVLKDNPNVKGMVEFNGVLDNYRASEPFALSKGFVDFCFNPYIVTQRLPHWIHGGKGESLGVTYAHLCNLSMTDAEIRDRLFIATEEVPDLPDKFVTFHPGSTQDPKNYDHWDQVFSRLKDIAIIQIGSEKDPLLEREGVIDMRGKTNEQQLAFIIQKAMLHIGVDSFPAHVANAMYTRSVIVYGGTYARQGGLLNSVAIEPPHRNGCQTSCHLVDCEIKKRGGQKCINNIDADHIADTICNEIGAEFVTPPKPLTISAYCIIRDGIKYKFPYKECIKAALKVADEFIMVDGGSTDGTWEDLEELATQLHRPSGGPTGHNPLKVYKHEWDMSNPMVMGAEKTWARQQCTGDYCIQLDADEIIVEQQEGQIKRIIRTNPKVPIFDFPVVNLYGDDNTVRIDDQLWKWRLSKNIPEIVHSVHGGARELDPTTMKIIFDKKVSDGCEYVHKDTLEIYPNVNTLPPEALKLHDMVKQMHLKGESIPPETIEMYCNMLKQMTEHMPVVYHYSWCDLEAKKQRGDFWNETVHGKEEATHNTTKDIAERIEQGKELTIEISLPHPLTAVKVPEFTDEQIAASREHMQCGLGGVTASGVIGLGPAPSG